MGKIWIEVCLISARGLRRRSSFLKLQWFAVGWIDPENKYCTKVDTSGNGNPVWKTKFSMAVDLSEESKFQNLALHVEVYSREPFFLRQSHLGSATVVLKEFVDKFDMKPDVSKPVEEVGSFQLRKKSSNKPLGFVDVSIRISEEREESGSSYIGGKEGFHLADRKAAINLASSGYGSPPIPPLSDLPPSTFHPPENTHLNPFPPNHPQHHHHRQPFAGPNYPPPTGPAHHPSRLPPPPPLPPSNVGYTPSFFPINANYGPSNSSYISMPSSVEPPGLRGAQPGFGMGVGVGALAAGAVLFGDDFMSGFNFPAPSSVVGVAISACPPF